MKYIVIAPVASGLPEVLNALSQIDMKEAVLVYYKTHKELAEEVSEELKKKGVPSTLRLLADNYWEDAFHIVSEVKKLAGDKDIIVNLGASNGVCKCVMMSAAFVNGIKAIDVLASGEKVMLPIMKFSYYKLLSPKKMELLQLLYGSDCCDSMEELSKRTKMSLPLVSYHVNGNLKSQGLIELGLIETHTVSGRVKIKLSLLGKLLVQGLIDQAKE